MDTLPRVLAVLLAVLLASIGAVSQADDPPPGPHATLRIASATSGVAASSWVNTYSSEACEEKKGEGRMASFHLLRSKEKTVFVPVGKRLYLLAGAEVTPPVGAEVRKSKCLAMASFVPEDGKAYDVKHDLVTRNCPIVVTLGGAAVATFEKHKPKDLCKDKF
ncbi:MAG: hypothetical protein ACT4PK_05915 [Gammaproteobacteria bacterium]